MRGETRKKDPAVTQRDIRDGLDRLGTGTGSAGMVHSSLSSFGTVDGGALGVIKALMQQVSGKGTILMPAFVQKVNGRRASYPERETEWNVETSPSDVGLVTETFRTTTSVIRSDHPSHSICTWGRNAKEATRGHRTASGRPSPWCNRAFGVGSPWDWMYENDVHYLLMGVDFNVCTMLHYVQALFAERNGLYEGNLQQWPIFSFPAVGEKLKEKDIVDETTVGRSRWYHLGAKSLVDEALGILEGNPEMIKPTRIAPYLSEE